MTECLDLTRIGALLGDAARSNMVLALFRVPALTASELAAEGGVTRATASAHLRRLSDEGLLKMRPAGRHRYYELADAEVAYHVEQLLGLAQHLRQIRTRPGPADPALRRARRCYDHLAGEIGVTLFDRLRATGAFGFDNGKFDLSPRGAAVFDQMGIDPTRFAPSRPTCRECLDWSQRRPHLAGAAGAALLDRLTEIGWLLPVPGSRALSVTARGEGGLKTVFLS